MNYSGQLITLEGLEGAGKSSVIPFLEQDIRQRGLEVLITREPGGTELAEKIRQLLLHEHKEPVDRITETLLMWAARRQHWLSALVPALSAGTWVICDRFVDSSIAYQQYGRGVNEELIKMLRTETLDNYQPALTLLFDVDLEESFVRIRQGGRKPDRIEQETTEFFHRVAQGYRQLAQRQSHPIVVIDSNRQQERVIREARQALANLLQEMNSDYTG